MTKPQICKFQLYHHLMAFMNDCADKEVVVPRCDQSVRDTESAGHNWCPDLHHQQRQGRVLERATSAQAREGRHQQLWSLRAQPPRFLPLLLSRLQGNIKSNSQQKKKKVPNFSCIWISLFGVPNQENGGAFNEEVFCEKHNVSTAVYRFNWLAKMHIYLDFF